VPGQLLKVLDFTVGTLSVGGVAKSIETFLYSESFAGFFVDAFPHNAVGTFAQFLKTDKTTEVGDGGWWLRWC